MSDWNPNSGEADIEMTINGVEAEYTIYYDYEYEPAQTSRYSGTSHQENEEFPESHGFTNLQVELVGDGSFTWLTSEEEEFAVNVLLERVGEL